MNLFLHLGLFVEKNFLDQEFILERIFPEICAAPTKLATVVPMKDNKLLQKQLWEDYRKTTELKISDLTKTLLKERLIKIKPMLEQHFNLSLADCQEPIIYRYNTGDFFGPHQDCSDCPDAPNFLRERRISVVIFLNGISQSSMLGQYCGGDLTFYGLIDDPKWQPYGLPFPAEARYLSCISIRCSSRS